jgi:hypothetical protein
MKKYLLTVVLIAAALVVIPTAASFASSSAPKGVTQVTGAVTNNGQAVKGAKVSVTCVSTTKNTKTDKTGTYLVQFNAKKCPLGSVITAAASKGKQSGSKTGTATSYTPQLNVALINISIPEFSTVLGIVALVVAAGAFLSIRSRKTNAGKIA